MYSKLAMITAAVLALSTPAFAEPGVTATEIKIGSVYPFSGPASALGLVGKSVLAYVQYINDRGGINGRKINYIAMDDGYSPPKTVEQVRKLVESDEVAFLFGQLGTPGNTATAKYITSKGVPGIAIVTGSSKFTVVKDYPLTTTSLVSYFTEGEIYAKYLGKALPNGKYGILYQNDDLGKDYISGFKALLKDNYDKKVVALSYEITDPTVDSQIVNLKNAGVDSVLVAGTPKFAAQAIRKIAELGWKPVVIVNYPSNSAAATLKPAGLDKSVGVIAGATNKDPSDKQWDNDAGMKGFREFFEKYLPGADISDANYSFGYNQGMILEQILKKCGNDLSRENIVKQARDLKGVVLPMALPGITISTTPTVNTDWTQMQLQKWTGTEWEQFGKVLDAGSD